MLRIKKYLIVFNKGLIIMFDNQPICSCNWLIIGYCISYLKFEFPQILETSAIFFGH